jgi:hypothetical protein
VPILTPGNARQATDASLYTCTCGQCPVQVSGAVPIANACPQFSAASGMCMLGYEFLP